MQGFSLMSGGANSGGFNQDILNKLAVEPEINPNKKRIPGLSQEYTVKKPVYQPDEHTFKPRTNDYVPESRLN